MKRLGEAKGGREKDVPRWLRTVAFVWGLMNVLGMSNVDLGLGGVAVGGVGDVDSAGGAFSISPDCALELDSAEVVSDSGEDSAEDSDPVLLALLAVSSSGDLTSRSISIAAGSTETKSPGFKGVFGFICFFPLSLTFPCTTSCLACHALVAKQHLNKNTSIRLSTSTSIKLVTGVGKFGRTWACRFLPAYSCTAANPPELDPEGEVEVVGRVLGRVSGRNQRWKRVSEIQSPW